MIHERPLPGRAVAEALKSSASADRQASASLADGSSPSFSRKVTIKGLVEMPEWKGTFTESAIRGLLDKGRTRRSSRGVIRGNGLLESGAVIRLGKKILFDTIKFRAWVESHRVNQEGEGS